MTYVCVLKTELPSTIKYLLQLRQWSNRDISPLAYPFNAIFEVFLAKFFGVGEIFKSMF